MRHKKSGVKLGRTASHRNAMFRNMVTSLFKYDSINTTDAKAKELRKWADSMITLAKRGDLHARRQALSIIREKDVVHKLFEEAPSRFGSLSGGYTRITKLGLRPGDTAQMSIIELMSPTADKAKPKKKAASISTKTEEAPKVEETVKDEEVPKADEAPETKEAAPAEEAAEPTAESVDTEKTEDPAPSSEDDKDK